MKGKEDIIKWHREQAKMHEFVIEQLTLSDETGKQEPMFGQALELKNANFVLSVTGGVFEDFNATISALERGSYFLSIEAAEKESERRRLRQLARIRMTESWQAEKPECPGYIISPLGTICKSDINGYPLQFKTSQCAENFLIEVSEIGIRKIYEL